MADRYAVFGNPVAHSRSPWIHARFAEQTGENLRYDRQEVPLDGFAEAVQAFQDAGGRGLNITVPFKEQAWELADAHSERAGPCGAVNTLVLQEDGSRFGDNTDGTGLVNDLRDNLVLPLTGRRLLVLGAGGAVRGVLPALAAERPAMLTVANRTVARAEAVLPLCQGAAESTACGFDALAGLQFDIIVNGTSTGLEGGMPPLPDGLAGGCTAYDMVYGPRPTAFLSWAREQGADSCHDGLGMLVEQAAESFRVWRGMRPETAPVIDALRREIAAGT